MSVSFPALHSIPFTFALVICFQTSCHTNSFKKPKLCRKCKDIRMIIHDKPGNVMQRKSACKYGPFSCQRLCLLMTQLCVLITGQRGNWFHVHQFLMFFFFLCVCSQSLAPTLWTVQESTKALLPTWRGSLTSELQIPTLQRYPKAQL